MKTKQNLLAFLIHASALCLAPLVHSATYYWDTDGATAGAGGSSPTGNWVTAGSTWSTNANGTVAVSAVTTTTDDDLIFSAGVNATGNYSIDLSDTQSAKSLTVRTGNVNISGSGGIALGGTGIIHVTNNLSATGVNAASIGSATDTILSGTVGLTKTGAGTLTLNGSAAHTFTGGLRVNGGTLGLNFINLLTPTNLVDSGNALSLGGGNLAITGSAFDVTNQTFAGTTINSGGGSLLVNPNNGSDSNISLGSLTATASGGSFIVGRALSSGSGLLSITTTSSKDATGIYGGRVVFANGTANTGYDWATTEDVASPYTLTSYFDYTDLDLTAGSDSANSFLSNSATMTGSRTTNSLKFQSTASAQSLTVGSGNTLNLSSGGLLFTGASVATGPRIGTIVSSASVGEVTVGNGSGSYDLVVHQYNAGNFGIGFASTGTALNAVPGINANIVNNGSNPVTLVKNGPGALLIGGTANTFSGGIIVNEGNIFFNSLTAINNNPMTFNANSIMYTANNSATSGNITLNNGSQLTILNNNTSFTVTGNVLGNGGISVAHGGQGAITVNLSGTGNNFTGPVRFTANNGSQAASLNVSSFVDTNTIGSGNITFGAGGASSTSHNFSLASTAIAPLTLTNRSFEMAGDNVNQQINNNSTHLLSIANDLIVSGTRGKNLQFGGTGNITFAGAIGNSANPTAPGTIPNAIRRTGNGTVLGLASVEGIAIGATVAGQGVPTNPAPTVTVINPHTREITLSAGYTATTNTAINVGAIFTVTNVVNSVTLTKAGAGTLTLSNENSSFTGNTLISAGTLVVTKLANLGENSSIGKGGVGSSIIGLGQSATLRYTGSSNSSTNRAVAATTTAGNTGFTLEASGAGTVAFTNTDVLAAGTNNQGRYYTLTGINTGNNVFAAQINNNGTSTDNTNVTKAGTGKWVLTNPNSAYTGGTFVNEGTLSTNALTDSGVASPVGAGVRLPLLGRADTTGTLEYTGSGHSTNRDTRIGTPSALPGIGGGVILNNGTGALTFTAPNFNLSQTDIIDTRTLTLGGTFTGAASEIQGVIQDNTASTGLINVEKTGPGTWLLSGANTYSGTTTVSGGTLTITGATQATSSITVGASGSLGLNVNSPVTASAAAVTLGGTVTISGTPTLPSYTLLSAASISGTPTLASPVPGYELVVDGTALKLNSVGGDMTPPTLVSITDNVSGGPVNIGDTITYTVTFSEDINAASLSTADFNNNGSANVTIDSVSETSPGVVAVSATVTSPGTVKLRIPTGAVIEDVALNDLVVPVEDDTTITVRNAYQTWALTNAISSAPGADKDNDGVNNAVEFVLGGNVGGNDAGKLPIVTTDATNMIVTFQRQRSSIDGVTALVVEVGTTLSTWPTVYNVGTTTGNSSSGVAVTPNTPDGFDTITVTIPKDAAPSKYARLKVTVTE